MPIIHPGTYKTKSKPARVVVRKRFLTGFLLVLVCAGIINYLRPLPDPQLRLAHVSLDGSKTMALPWPTTGQAAVGADGYGVLATYGEQRPLATASIAKIITALCVLEKLPLGPNEQGPSFTISRGDVDIYNRYLAEDGSLVPVASGEIYTERQALEAILIPSANNMADSLAIWAFGSLDKYTSYANAYVARHGLNATRVGTDASGFDPSTTSTANDLAKLGLLALRSQTLLGITSMKSTVLPQSGVWYNYNTVLGINGITGLKTGNSAANPGAFLFSARATVDGKPLQTVGVVMGAANLTQALRSASIIAGAMPSGFTDSPILRKGKLMGTARTAWGDTVPVELKGDLTTLRWHNSPLSGHFVARKTNNPHELGSFEVKAGAATASSPTVIRGELPKPTIWWRLTRH